MKITRKRCNCGTWACRLDSLLHRLHITWPRICDAHDRRMLQMDPWTFTQWSSPTGNTWVYLDSTNATAPAWRVVKREGGES